MIACIILAGGESSRMDSPKALLKINEETFAECIARKASKCGIQTTILVAGAHYEEIQSALKGKCECEVILNPEHLKGQLTSLQAGLRKLSPDTKAALIWPVDQPLVKEETISILIETYEKEGQSLTIPVFNSRRGHPVIYDRSTFETILSLDYSHTAKDLQTIYKDKTSLVEVDDSAILVDIDTPEDYKRYITDAAF